MISHDKATEIFEAEKDAVVIKIQELSAENDRFKSGQKPMSIGLNEKNQPAKSLTKSFRSPPGDS